MKLLSYLPLLPPAFFPAFVAWAIIFCIICCGFEQGLPPFLSGGTSSSMIAPCVLVTSSSVFGFFKSDVTSPASSSVFSITGWKSANFDCGGAPAAHGLEAEVQPHVARELRELGHDLLLLHLLENRFVFLVRHPLHEGTHVVRDAVHVLRIGHLLVRRGHELLRLRRRDLLRLQS